MTPPDGGWTWVAINTVDAAPTLFPKSFAEYTAGRGDYGNVHTSGAWIGLEAMHRMSQDGNATTRAVTNTRMHNYATWKLDSAAIDYTLYVPNPGNSNAGLRYANGRIFSAFNLDSDASASHCASDDYIGWWYNHRWYIQYASSLTGSSYRNEPAVHPTDHYTTVRMWRR
jgi:hypothetical protein